MAPPRSTAGSPRCSRCSRRSIGSPMSGRCPATTSPPTSSRGSSPTALRTTAPGMFMAFDPGRTVPLKRSLVAVELPQAQRSSGYHLSAGPEVGEAARGIALVLGESFGVESDRIAAIEQETLVLFGLEESPRLPDPGRRRAGRGRAAHDVRRVELPVLDRRATAVPGPGSRTAGQRCGSPGCARRRQPLDVPRGVRRQRGRPPDVRRARLRPDRRSGTRSPPR